MTGWVGPVEFKTSILALNLPDIAGGIGSFSMIFLVFSAFFSINLLLLKIGNYKKKQLAWLTLQWLFTPLIMVILVALPALDAQTRLMFGRYMGFWNTPKYRNHSK